MFYSRAESSFIREHYFASKSFSALREEFTSAYPDKKVPNKTTTHRLVTNSVGTGSVLRQEICPASNNVDT
jgi:hypothetical protein